MSNAKIRFELRLAPGFNNVWGFFDTKEDRFVKKEDGHSIPIRVSKEERGAMVVEQLNAAHEAAEKLRREQEFEAAKPKTTAKRGTKKADPKPAPVAETKPEPLKRTPPKRTAPKAPEPVTEVTEVKQARTRRKAA